MYELEGNANDTGRGFGQSAVFNGSTSKINFGNVLNTTFESNWSVSAWINFNSGTSGAIFQKGLNILNGQYIRLYTRSSTPRIQFGYSEGSANGVNMSTNSYDPAGKGWVHIVGTADYSGSFKLYVNGSLVETQAVTGGAPSFSMADPLHIGYNGDGGGYVNGNIDDVRLYSSVLTSTEVEYLYKNDTSNIPTANLASHWKLNGNANDSIGSINGTETDITYSDGVSYNGTATNVLYAYDGTPTNVSFAGTSFQPDFVWLRSRTQNDNHYLQDVVRGATRRLHSNLNVAEQSPDANRFTSFDTNGFTVGSDNSVNMTGHDYVAWCFKAGGSAVQNTDGSITSSVSANQDAGFSVVKYDGATNATTDTSDNGGSYWNVGHGLSSPPEMVIAKKTNNVGGWYVGFNISGVGSFDIGSHLVLNSSAAKVDTTSDILWGNQNPTSTTFGVGGWDVINRNGDSYIAYCFHSVDGYQKVGTYTGVSSGVTITTGFRPRFIMVKSTSNVENWSILDTIRGSQKSLSPNLSDVETNTSLHTFTVSDTGFSFPDQSIADAMLNENGYQYIYLAIA